MNKKPPNLREQKLNSCNWCKHVDHSCNWKSLCIKYDEYIDPDLEFPVCDDFEDETKGNE